MGIFASSGLNNYVNIKRIFLTFGKCTHVRSSIDKRGMTSPSDVMMSQRNWAFKYSALISQHLSHRKFINIFVQTLFCMFYQMKQ